MPPDKPVPTFDEEKVLWEKGVTLVAGIDEVGRGALAGPVAAAAVIWPKDLKAPWCSKVRDSKLLTPKERGNLFTRISETAVAVGIGIIPSREIDKYGIAKAARLAMKMAVEKLAKKPDSLLIDFFKLPEVNLPQKGVVDGDSLCFSIACASIIAKVARDELMVGFDRKYPGYNLAENKGYCTEEHLECLSRLGPSAIHRVSFQPVREAMRPGK